MRQLYENVSENEGIRVCCLFLEYYRRQILLISMVNLHRRPVVMTTTFLISVLAIFILNDYY